VFFVNFVVKKSVPSPVFTFAFSSEEPFHTRLLPMHPFPGPSNVLGWGCHGWICHG
jgi:hypothetical protein